MTAPRPDIACVTWDDALGVKEGGFGWVRFGTYRAKPDAPGAPCAVKILKPEADRSDEEALKRLRHCGIIAFYEAGDFDGYRCVIMERAAESLEDRLGPAGIVDPCEAAAFGAEVADALEHAHRKGLIHRDLAPKNILLTDRGGPRLADFGLSKQIRPGEDPSRTSRVQGGTPGYVSPEQGVRLWRAGPASDIWSLGQVLHRMTVGFPAADLDPVFVETQVPGPLALVVGKAMAEQPGARYRSARAMAVQLRNVAEGRPVTDPGLAGRALRPARRWAARHPGIVAGLIACLILATVAGAWLLVDRRIDQMRQAEGLRRDRQELLARLGRRAFGEGTRATAARLAAAMPDDLALGGEALGLQLLHAGKPAEYDAVRARARELDARAGGRLGPPGAFARLIEEAGKVHAHAADAQQTFPMPSEAAGQLRRGAESLGAALDAMPPEGRPAVLAWMRAVTGTLADASDLVRDVVRDDPGKTPDGSVNPWTAARTRLLVLAEAEPASELYYAAATCAGKEPLEGAPPGYDMPLGRMIRQARAMADIAERGLGRGACSVNPGGPYATMPLQQATLMRLFALRLDPAASADEVEEGLDAATEAMKNPLCPPGIRLLGRLNALVILTTGYDPSQEALWRPAGGSAPYRDRIQVAYRFADRILRDWEADEPELPTGPDPWDAHSKAMLDRFLERYGCKARVRHEPGIAQEVSRELRAKFREMTEAWYRTESARTIAGEPPRLD